MNVEQQLRHYILDNFLFTDDQSALNNNDSFLNRGILDSTGILEVIHFLEDEFNIHVEDDELIPENLDSIDNIVSYLSKKTNF